MNIRILIRHTALLVFPLALFPVLSTAQPSIQWQKCLGGSGWDSGSTLARTSDGGYVVAGYTRSLDGDVSGFHGGSIIGDVWVVKVDAGGGVLWQRCLGGSSDEEALSIQQTPDGGFILAGYTNSTDGDVLGLHPGLFSMWGDAWVIKLSTAGEIVWQRCLGGSRNDRAQHIQLTADGGYIVAGRTNSFDGDVTCDLEGDDAWVIKLDEFGNTEWASCYGGDGTDDGHAIEPTPDGGYILVGSTKSEELSGFHGTSVYEDVLVVKLGPNGEPQWQKCLGGTSDDEAYTVEVTPDGGYLVAGETSSVDGDVSGNHGGALDAWLVKLDGTGNILWQDCIGGSGTDLIRSILSVDGGFLVGGFTTSGDGDMNGFHGGSDAWVMLLSASGAIQWQKCMGGSGSEYTNGLVLSVDGSVIVAGGATVNSGDVNGLHGEVDTWLVKLSPITGLNEQSAPLLALAPNPAHSFVSIGFGMDLDPVSIVLVDAMGRMVTTESVQRGSRSHRFDLRNVRPGSYFLLARMPNGDLVTDRFVVE